MESAKPTPKPRPIWATYGVALFSVGAAILIRWLLDPFLHDQLQLLTLYGAVAMAVWFGGWRPALLASMAGYVLAQYIFISPRYAFDFASPVIWAGLIGYSLSCGIIIFLGEAMRRARGRVEEHSSRLEQEMAERERTEQALAESARRREVLYKFVERRRRATSLKDIYDSALDAILGALRCDRASILLLDDSGTMRFTAWRHLSDAYCEAVDGHSPWKTDDPEPEPIWIADVADSDLDVSLKALVRREGIRALAFVPLIAEDRLIGKFTIYYNAPHVFSDDEIELSLSIALQLALGTERKRAEEQLHANEERLRLATQTGKIGIWEWDIPKNRVSWTDSLFVMHGVKKEDFNATAEGFAALVHPDDREFVSKAIEQTLTNDAPYELTFRALRSDGTVVWLFTNAMVVRDGQEPLRMIGTTTDITELKQAEEALSRAKGQAEEANRAKDQFLAMLSHELRTPLTPVLMTASALEGDRTIATDLREQLGMIRRNIELEARLIDDLLDVTRIAHGKFDLRDETVDLHAAIEHALSISALELETKKLHVTKKLEATEYHCRGDAARLQEVFWNILRNAVKFTPRGGKIDISTRNDGDHSAIIEFSDSGIGIEPELRPRIFDAFEQGARAHGVRYGGLGLGLAISKRIVDLHKGKIEARSPGPGQGSTFSVTLNTIQAPQAPERAKPLPAKHPADAAQILIVEDHKDTSDVLRRILENSGYSVTVCNTTEKARTAADRRKFNLVISDIALSDGSGLDLMRHLSEAQGLNGIALSGFGTQEDVRASKKAGFAAHLTKPVDLERLRETIVELLGQGKSIEPQTTSP